MKPAALSLAISVRSCGQVEGGAPEYADGAGAGGHQRRRRGQRQGAQEDHGADQGENGPLVDEGLQYLNQAVANRPNYDDAMAYLNLIYRRKADVDYGNADAVKADVAAAKDWSTKAMGTRKANEEKKNAGPAASPWTQAAT